MGGETVMGGAKSLGITQLRLMHRSLNSSDPDAGALESELDSAAAVLGSASGRFRLRDVVDV